MHNPVDDVSHDAILVDERKLKLNKVSSNFHDVLVLIEGVETEITDYVLKEMTELKDEVNAWAEVPYIYIKGGCV